MFSKLFLGKKELNAIDEAEVKKIVALFDDLDARNADTKIRSAALLTLISEDGIKKVIGTIGPSGIEMSMLRGIRHGLFFLLMALRYGEFDQLISGGNGSYAIRSGVTGDPSYMEPQDYGAVAYEIQMLCEKDPDYMSASLKNTMTAMVDRGNPADVYSVNEILGRILQEQRNHPEAYGLDLDFEGSMLEQIKRYVDKNQATLSRPMPWGVDYVNEKVFSDFCWNIRQSESVFAQLIEANKRPR